MEREIYQKQYDFELEQRNSIASAINIPMMAITILGGALSAVILGFSYASNLITYLFCTIVGLSIISLSYSLFCVFKSFLGYSYQKLPASSLISLHYKKLVDWHRENGENQENSDAYAKNDFYEYINQRLSEAAEHNGNNNIKRGNYLHKATTGVAVSVFFMFFTSFLYVHNRLGNNNSSYNVKIINEVKLDQGGSKMTNESGNDSNSSTQETSPAQSPTAAPSTTNPKPEGPPNVVFRGNTEKPGIVTKKDSTQKE